MKVHILCTLRKPELKRFTTLVFDTIRVGFPTAEINVWLNRCHELEEELREKSDGSFHFRSIGIIHHQWIEELVAQSNEPFWLVDTDVIFYEKVEDWQFTTPIAGYRVPEFLDEFTNAATKPRLHTSLLFIDPVKVREAITKYESQFPDTIFNPKANLFHPLCLPNEGGGIFYDTCALLFQAIGGTEFTDAQKDAYSHLHFGTIGDLVLPRLRNGAEMEKARAAILEKPELGRGLWRAQESWYRDRQVRREGRDVIAPISPEDSALARQWNAELCCGNEAAMSFTDLWYGLVHAWDDAIDTMLDGKLTMSADQLIREIGFRSAMLYNHPFYVANRELLFPIVLHITSTWRVSVAWERSPMAHLRAIADACRTCGNHLYYFIALVTGGEQHAQQMILRIHERDFLKQHDSEGRPI